MGNNFVVKKEIMIHAPASAVWKALTDPALIKQYLFGTETVSEWKVGSPIVYKGIWQGKEYEDKGIILQMKPGEIFQSTYWSPMSGTEDIPENYMTVTYELSAGDEGTRLTLTQDNCTTKEMQAQSANNWGMVLNGLRELLEKE